MEKIGRRNNIPILYTRGTHYEVGFDVVSEVAFKFLPIINYYSLILLFIISKKKHFIY